MAIKKPTFELNGKIVFTDIDPLAARFEMDDPDGKLMSNKKIQLDPKLFPEDFDLMAYDVTGEYTLIVNVKKK